MLSNLILVRKSIGCLIWCYLNYAQKTIIIEKCLCCNNRWPYKNYVYNKAKNVNVWHMHTHTHTRNKQMHEKKAGRNILKG